MAEKKTELTLEDIGKAVTELAKGMKGLGDVVTELQTSGKATTETLTALAGQVKEGVKIQAPPPKDDDDNDFDGDLESLSRKEMFGVFSSQIIKALKKEVVDPLNERMDSLTTSATRTDMKAEIKELNAKYDDFGKYKEGIMELAEKNPQYSLEHLYIVTKAQNPIKELDDEGNEIPDDKGKPVKNVLDFGGLTPTSGTSTESKGALEVDEAAEKAWNDATIVDEAEG